ncbi:MAG: hypothetical protein DBX55_05170 [Verrucomicrobia bacterium]|nr:MAG: hypothetical protein DBX55_05170 [Verrucomicrobiota bacterium]
MQNAFLIFLFFLNGARESRHNGSLFLQNSKRAFTSFGKPQWPPALPLAHSHTPCDRRHSQIFFEIP